MANNLSNKGIELLIELESLRLKPYDDRTGTPLANWNRHATIGIGHLILKKEWYYYKSGISEDEAYDLKRKDSERFINAVNEYVHAKLNQNQFDALVIFCFNIGVGGFRYSTVLKLINNPKTITGYSSLESAWKAWNKQRQTVTVNGKKVLKKVVVKGLVNRRKKEWNLYNGGI
jgi:type VI secretion system secreted protein VgrG